MASFGSRHPGNSRAWHVVVVDPIRLPGCHPDIRMGSRIVPMSAAGAWPLFMHEIDYRSFVVLPKELPRVSSCIASAAFGPSDEDGLMAAGFNSPAFHQPHGNITR